MINSTLYIAEHIMQLFCFCILLYSCLMLIKIKKGLSGLLFIGFLFLFIGLTKISLPFFSVSIFLLIKHLEEQYAKKKKEQNDLETLIQIHTKELAKTENFWKGIFDGLPDLISIQDKRHKIIRINKAMAEYFQSEVANKTVFGQICYKNIQGKTRNSFFLSTYFT